MPRQTGEIETHRKRRRIQQADGAKKAAGMMEHAQELIAHADTLGVRLAVGDGKLKLYGPKEAVEELLPELRRCAKEVAAQLPVENSERLTKSDTFPTSTRARAHKPHEDNKVVARSARPSQDELRRLWRRHFDMCQRVHEAWAQDGYTFPAPQTPPFPEELHALTCGARTRKGTACKRRDLYHSGRCRLHGGLSTGPRTAKGKRRSSLNRYRKKQTP